MKILVDQNISHRILPYLSPLFGTVAHVKDIGMMDAFDLPLFLEARKQGFEAVLTQDEDFYHILLAQGPPPKVIWLRVGNRSTNQLALVVSRHKDVIEHFLQEDQQDCLEIFG
jgi:predicted nuclease of predicted toxin-antitoxin system